MAEGRPANDPCGAPDLGPHRPGNRPGLPEIAYRVSTHPTALARMLADIPRVTRQDLATGEILRPLAGLGIRDLSDPSIALLDAWAASVDVLSFYSERIANEGYLRTATDRASMVELTRSIGYELAPGVAAGVHLAFTVEAADDPFRTVDVPEGTQAMSVPQARGDLPQVFETVEPILARAEWNAIPAQTERVQHLAIFRGDAEDDRNGRLFAFDLDNSFEMEALEGEVEIVTSAEGLAPFYPLSDTLDLPAALAELQSDADFNDEIVPELRAVEVTETYLRGTALRLAKGDRVLAVGARNGEAGQEVATAPLQVVEAEALADYDLTRVVLQPVGSAPRPRKRLPKLRPARLRKGAITLQPVTFNAASVDTVIRRTAWSGDRLNAFIKTQAWPRLNLMRLIRKPVSVASPPLGDVVPGLHALREKAAFFGNTAPRQESLADAGDTRGDDPYDLSWDNPVRPIWTDSQGAALTEAQAYLDRELEGLSVDGWVLLENPAGEVTPLRLAAVAGASRADFAMHGKATGLTFRKANGDPITIDPGNLDPDLAPFTFRTARAHLRSEHLAPAGAPLTEDISEGETEIVLDTLYLDLERGRAISVAGERADAPGVIESETVEIADVIHVGGLTRVLLAAGLTYSYRRPTVELNANVALASHGEAQEEAIGSGDATKPKQAFKLAKTPLTFITAATETGRASTLTIRVDGVAWAEVPSLADAGPEDEVFQLRIDDDGTHRVIFGDGRNGRRPPTGQLNVSASYRAGLGPEGELPDEAIIQLKTRPLGIRAVVNPSPATGAAAPETLDEARERAPQSVRVLGRIVSLTDFEDFARSFAGIGKAAATALWSGRERLVQLTVTPETDSVFDTASPTLESLGDAIASLRNPGPRLILAPHQPKLFWLNAKITYESKYLAEDVEVALRDALARDFGFDARRLAQPVSAAEVVTALQNTDGVHAVDLDALDLYDAEAPEAEPGLANVLPSRPARVTEAGKVLPAELLTILDAGVALTFEEATDV